MQFFLYFKIRGDMHGAAARLSALGPPVGTGTAIALQEKVSETMYHPAFVQITVFSLPFESSSSARASSERWLL